MKRVLPLLMALLSPLLITACNQQHPAGKVTAVGGEVAAAAPEAAPAMAAGTVTETMNTSGYTYVQVDTGDEKIWAAAPECVVKVGDRVAIPEGMAMYDYPSQTLNRKFDLVYFVGSIQDEAGLPLPPANGLPLSPAKGLPAGHPPTAGHGLLGQKANPDEIDVSGVDKVEGGRTVAEIYGAKTDLSGKEVKLRGKVVKYNRQIMGKNWLHVRDGSGDSDAGTHDLTVTSDVAVQVGDTVLVTGQVHLDKDFGYGYQYDVILEDAQVVVE